MRKFITLLFVVMLSFGLVVTDANAKRFGGGRSFGMTRSFSNNYQYGRTANYQTSPRGYAANRWIGPLGGLLMGGLLGSLFFSHGFGSGLLSWLLVGGILMLIVNLLRRSHALATPQTGFTQQTPFSNWHNSNQTTAIAASNSDSFINEAKSSFYRLQAAYDEKNLFDLRSFTAPEVFAEIQMQLNERGDAANFTEVVSLNADLFDTQTETAWVSGQSIQRQIASVRFSGLIREETNGLAKSFNEIWHFTKTPSEQRWRVAGIEQSQ